MVACNNFVVIAPPHTVTPHTRCRLKLLKMERIKDFLLMEEELIRNQEQLRPQEKKNEVSYHVQCIYAGMCALVYTLPMHSLLRQFFPILFPHPCMCKN